MTHRAMLSVVPVAVAAVLLLQWPIAAYTQNPEWIVFDSRDAGFPPDGVNSVFVDTQGAVWLGLDPGIAKYDGQTWVFYTKTNSGLPYNIATPFGCDKNGNVMIRTYNLDQSAGSARGLVVYDGANWTVYNKSNVGLPSNNIFSGAVDKDGNIWLGTVAGLARFDGANWTTYTKKETGLPSELISTLHVDGEGHVWAGSSGKGLRSSTAVAGPHSLRR